MARQWHTGKLAGGEFEGLSACWADDAEVPMIECCDAGLAESFGYCNDAGIGSAEWQVGIRGDQISDANPVLSLEHLDLSEPSTID